MSSPPFCHFPAIWKNCAARMSAQQFNLSADCYPWVYHKMEKPSLRQFLLLRSVKFRRVFISQHGFAYSSSEAIS